MTFKTQALDLYKSIRRLHRHLPPALKFLGNSYVRDEFSRHRSADPSFIPDFLKAWTAYRDTLQAQLTANQIEHLGKKLDSVELNAFNEQQLGKMNATNMFFFSNVL